MVQTCSFEPKAATDVLMMMMMMHLASATLRPHAIAAVPPAMYSGSPAHNIFSGNAAIIVGMPPRW